MNALGKHTYLIWRGGAYSARLRVPLDLIEAMGRKELVKALGTSDPETAKRLVWAVVDGWQRQFDALRTRRLKDDQRVWLQTYPLEQLCMAGLVVGKMVVSAVC